MKSSNLNLKLLKTITVIAPGAFLALFEINRHVLFVEEYPMLTGSLIMFGIVVMSSFLFSRFIFGTIETMQNEIIQRNQKLATMNSVSLAVSQSLNLDIVLSRALEKVLDATSATSGEIFLLDEATTELVQRMQVGPFSCAFSEKSRFKIGEGLIGDVARSREAAIVREPSKDPRLLRQGLKESGFQCLACVPLKLKNRVIGVLNIGTVKTRCFTQNDLDLLVSIGGQIAVAVENAYLHEKVQSLAALEERERIAREMHDGMAQVLSYINTKSQAVKSFLEKGETEKAQSHLLELEESAREVYTDAREAILGLRIMGPFRQELVSALREYILHFNQFGGVKADLEVQDDNFPQLQPNIEIQVVRIIQEALTNVRKHAKAKHVWVRMAATNGQIDVVVKDDGQGFDVSNIKNKNWPHLGLHIMKERAEIVNGTLEINSSPEKGTSLTLKVPDRRIFA